VFFVSASFQGPGEALVLLAAAVSLQLAQGQSAEMLELMAAFFTVLGDNLALYALQLPADADDAPGSAALPPVTPP
jgi:hypothetical protein